MSDRKKLPKLLVSTSLLELTPDEGIQPLKLKLAWTMGGIIIMERKLRDLGIKVNVVSKPAKFWADLDSTGLAVAVWAMSQQEQPEYADDDGLDVIASYITIENSSVALAALHSAFTESLSKKGREALKKAEEETQQEGAPKDPSQAQS